MQYLILIFLALYIHGGGCKTRTYYFAYGSNLLANRLHINIPKAELYGTAFLPNYTLDFVTVVPLWNGAVATIYEEPGATVWGAIWLIDNEDLTKLDEQEGVNISMYSPIKVNVTLPQVPRVITARTYVQNHNVEKIRPGVSEPFDRRPSITYREVIIFGAIEVGLPKEYIAQLRKIPHNGKLATTEIRQKLGERFNSHIR